MAKNHLDSTILHEHRRVAKLRYILTLIAFVSVLFATLTTRYFVTVRGASDGVVLSINLLCVINALQIFLCFWDFFLRFGRGVYSNACIALSYLFGVLWVAVTAFELVIASVELGALRLDLFTIAIGQAASAFLAYLFWPSREYFFVQGMTKPKIINERKKRRNKTLLFNAWSWVLFVLLFGVQLFSVFIAYRLPPRVYDLFANNRALEYRLNEDKTGYYVSGVYLGTSPNVIVPETYNNLPVIGISTGGLKDRDFLDKYKIKNIEIGTLRKDENGDEYRSSNVKYISEGAIVNDQIETLHLPVSIIGIEEGAFDSTSLKTVLYEAQSDFSIKYFNCSSLEKITLEGSEVGNIISLDGLNSSTTIEISKDNYNHYRQNNIEYGHSLRPILGEHEFYVDFYTNCDYYIESLFGRIGESILFGCEDLTNDQLTDLVSPMVDTLAYMENSHELGTAGARENSAFRGWYFDRAMEQECVFESDKKVAFTKTTSVYAKWIEEYTGTLNWGTFKPTDTPQLLYWTDEDVTSFPVIKDRLGYAAGVQWYVDGSDRQVMDSSNISESVVLNGVWILDKPTVDIDPAAIGDWYVTSPDKNAVEFTYDELNILSLNAEYRHVLDDEPYNGKHTAYSLKWEKVSQSDYEDLNTSIRVQNVADSGEYILNVTVTSPYGEQATNATGIKVSIAKKELNIGSFQLLKSESFYDSLNQVIETTGDFVDTNIKVTYTYYDDENNPCGANSGVTNAGRYTVRAVFEKNNEQEAANYNTQERISEFVIKPRELTFNSWSNGNLVYNGSSQSVKMSVGGVLAGDSVKINYNGDSKTDAGTYIAEAISVSDPNYTLAGIVDKCRFEWRIAPKEVTVKEWKLDNAGTTTYSVAYNGNAHSITAVANGVYPADTVNFTYAVGADTVRATNADTYTARITGVDNPNYYFNTNTAAAERQWTITKKPLTVVFSAVPSITYNGTQQGISATVTGIVSTDLTKFKFEDFLYEGKSDILAVKHQAITNGSQLKLTFSAVNAEKYTAAVSGISKSAGLIYQNYTLTGASKQFTISPKVISFVNDNSYTYNGKEQSLVLKVAGIVASDLEKVRLDQFAKGETSQPIVNGLVSGDHYHLVIKGTNAGNYNVGVDSFDNTNYTMTPYKNTIAIQKQALSVSWSIADQATGTSKTLINNSAYTYNYNGYKVTASVSGLVNGETVNLNVIGSEQKNANQYVTRATLPSTYTNYVMADQQISWQILPYTLDFAWKFNGQSSASAIPSFVYNAASVNVSPTYKLLGDDTVTLTYGQKDTVKTDVGTYTVQITDLGNANYRLGNKASLTWKITPKTVNVVWSDKNTADAVYNGQYQGPSFSINGILETENRFVGATVNNAAYNFAVPSTASGTEYSFSDAAKSVNVGTYSMAVLNIMKYDESKHDYVVDPNYHVTANTVDFTITKRPLVLSGIWSYANPVKGSNVYESSTSLVYNTKDFTLTTGIKSGLVKHLGVDADVSLVYDGNVAKDYQNLGYTARVTALSGTHAANYELPTANVSFKWSIQKKPVNFTWVGNSFVYTGNAHIQNATFQTNATTDSDGKVYTGDTVTIKYSNNSQSNAGSYTATVTGLSNQNYSVGSNSSYEWSIAPKPISLVWNTNSFVYNGAVQKPTAIYNGDPSVQVTGYSTVTSKNVGDYVITATKLNSTNYVIDGNSSASYKITPRTIKLSWRFSENGESAGNFIYDKAVHTVEAYATNLCSGDIVKFTYNPVERAIKNAGTYSFKVVDISNDNYKLVAGESNESKTVEIAKRVVSIVWNQNTYVYDGAEHVLTPTVTGVNSTDKVGFELNTAKNRLTDVGSVEVKVISLADDNYSIPASSADCVLTIEPQPVTVTWVGSATVTFDGVKHTLVPVVKGTNDGKEVKFAFSGDTARTNAGSQAITVTELDDKNYTLTGMTGLKTNTLKINPRPVNITWSGSTNVVYDGKAHTVTAKVTGVGGAAVGFKYSSTANTQIGAGNYTVRVDSLDDNNYTLSGAANTTCNLVINQQKVKIVWNYSTTTYTYDGTLRRIEPTIVGADDGKPLSVGSYKNGNSMTNAGSLVVAVSSLSDSNYTLSGADGSTSKTLVIEPQSVSISWNGVSSLTYDGKAHSMVASVVGKKDGKSVAITYETSSSQTNAGTYTVRFRLNDSNYTLDGATGSTSATMTIKQQPVVITWSGSASLTYDGSSHTLTPTVKGANTGATVNFSYTTDKSFTSAGTHTITIKLSDANYVVNAGSGNLSRQLTILAQPVTVTWNGMGSYVYDNNYHTLSATVKGTNDGRSVGFKYGSVGNQFKNVGDYTATISLTDSNYTLNNSTGSASCSLSITPQPVVITWNNTGSVYYNGSNHTVHAAVVGKNDGKTVSFRYTDSGNSFLNAGNYQATVKELTDSNYTLVGVTNLTSPKLIIMPQKVVITWTGTGSILYDGADHTIAATVTGAIDGKKLTATYQTLNNTYKNVGSYTAAIKSLSSTNYTLVDAVNVTSPALVINPQPVVITWSGTSPVVYDGRDHIISATVKGATDNVTVGFTYSATDRGFSDAGAYTVGIASLKNSNYTLSGVNNVTSPQLVIKPQPVRVDWSGVGTLEYDGQPHTISAQVKGANDGKSVSFDYSTENRSFTNVGTYTVAIGSLKNANYVLSGTEQRISPELTILPQAVHITWSGTGAMEYDGKAHEITAKVVGAKDGKTVSFTYVESSRSFTNVGTYAVSVSKLNNANYYISEFQSRTSPALTITPQAVVITWSSSSAPIEYDGQAHTLTATVKGAADGKAVAFTYNAGNRSFTNVGTYTASVLKLSDSNYTLEGNTQMTGTLVIVKKIVTVNWIGDTEIEADGQVHSLDAAIQGFTKGTDFTVTQIAVSEPGVYTYTVTLKNKNLVFSDGTTSTSAEMTIIEKPEETTEETTEAPAV